MKFFGEISEFKVQENKLQIRLPHYHRSATGLLSHTYVYAVPRISKNGTGQQLKEIILTPYAPYTWENLYRLEYKAKDKPGVNNVLTKILAQLNVNIYTQEGLTTDRENMHTVSLIVDIEGIKLENEKVKEEIISSLSNEIKDFLSQQNVEIKLEKIEKIRFLHDNHVSNSRHNLIEENELRNYFWKGFRSNPIKDKSVEIESDLLSDLEIINPNLKPNRSLQGTIVSDTEEKYILIRFFRPEQFVIYLDVVHKNVVGSIFKFTEIISSCEKNYNILSCYNRIEDVKNNAHWYVMLDVSSNPAKVLNLIKELNDKVHHVDRVKVVDYTENFNQKDINLPESEKTRLFNQKKEEKTQRLIQEKLKLEKELEKQNKREDKYQQTIISNAKYLILNAVFILLIGVLLLAERLPESWNLGLKILSVIIGATTFISAIINIRKHYKIKRAEGE